MFGVSVLCSLVFLVCGCHSCPNLNRSTICYSFVKPNVKRLYATKTTFTDSQAVLKESIRKNEFTTKGYTPIMVYSVMRHAIRYPDKEEIEEMRDLLPKMRDEIVKRKGQLCEEDIRALEKWKLNMEPDDDNNLSETGREETILYAMNLMNRFKKNLDPKKADIEVGVTPKVRTSQTADSFITGIRLKTVGKSAVCEDDSSESSEEKKVNYKLQHWKPKKIIKDFLNFHSDCKIIYKNSGGELKKPEKVLEFRKSDLISSVAQVVKNRLGIAATNLSDYEFLDLITRPCKFEYAIDKDSPWCAAVGVPELDVLEYLEDLEDYLEDGHGREMNTKMACPLMKDLITKINASVSDNSLKTYLYFTHAGALKRLWAYFGLFEDSDMTSDKTPEEGFCTRKDRKWRSSLNTPFGANVVTILYKRKDKRRKISRIPDYRVMTLVNGKPEKIRNCSSKFCSLEEFVAQFPDIKNCNLNEICSFRKSKVVPRTS